MQLIEGKRYYRVFLANDEVVEGIAFNTCEFENFDLSVTRSLVPESRTTIRGCEFRNSKLLVPLLERATLEDVLFENIRLSPRGLRTRNILFNRVKLKGHFNAKLMLNSSALGMYLVDNDDILQTFDDFTERYYQGVDWALDISEASFRYCEIRSNIPAHLIKRDPETQVLVR